jgi:hypothetical protein
MKTKGSLLILLLLTGVIVYAAMKKRKGSIKIGPLDKGEFLPDDRDAAKDLTDYEKTIFEL